MKTARQFTSLLILTWFFAGSLYSQEEKEQKWQLTGYLKDLITIDVGGDSLQVDNLLHNRLNFKWYPSSDFNIYIDVRNRLFVGKSVGNNPLFAQAVDLNNDYLDLSVQFPEGKNWLFHSMIDRAYFEWYRNDWEISFGRQRINWGVNLVWNPNDLFNAYSFFDFDYSERPGSDAIKVKKYLGFASSVEVAANMADSFDKMVWAGLFRWNKWNYDFQLIAGKARRDLVTGIGWAGNIHQAGFKGEATYFIPYKDDLAEETQLMASFAIDHAFKNTLYLHGSLLYNSRGNDKAGQTGFGLAALEPLTARNLSPFRWSLFLQSTYQFHPLLSGGVSVIYFPGQRNALFLNPTLGYSMKENWDLSLVLQWYYDKLYGEYGAMAQLIYFRGKWSF